MDKKRTITTVVIIVILAAVGLFYWQKYRKPGLTPQEQALEQAGAAADSITKSATQGALPSLDVRTNPLENALNINPADQINPFKNIKTNPFE